jgi:chlorobactene glucosyltransferase
VPEHWLAILLTTLWCAMFASVVVRFRDTRRLAEYAPVAGPDAPLVSVIIPARNEARNIGRLLNSLFASKYPAPEIIVVDDHSEDGTGRITRELAAANPAIPLRVIDAPPLPEGWFGKQWACQTGADAARGEILCFTDADTRHGPDLLGRSVSAMRSRGADLFTVAGHQEAGSFWEKVMQPFVFSILLSRFGGLETMSRSTRPLDKIANGQFVMMHRSTYTAIGGHAAVRDHVAEDLRLAQVVTERGLRAHMVLARDELSTRMYTSLGELRRGWGKNIYAAGRDTMPLGPVTSRIFPWIFPLPALVPIAPLVALVLWQLGIAGEGARIFGLVGGAFTTLFYIGVYAFSRLNPLWGLLYPLAAVTFSWISAEAAWRGSRVEWKGRGYVSRSAR